MNEHALESFIDICDGMMVPVEEGFIKNWKEKRKEKKEAKKRAKLAKNYTFITQEEEDKDIKEILSKVSSSVSTFKKAITNLQADPRHSEFHNDPKFIEQLRYANSVSKKYLWVFDDIDAVEDDIRHDGYPAICSLDLRDIYSDLKEKYGNELVIDIEDLSYMGWKSIDLQFGEGERFKTKYHCIDVGEAYKELSICVSSRINYKVEE